MSKMIKVQKINTETGEPYEKWAWPEEGKKYSDFRHMESLLMKLANYYQEREPEAFKLFLDQYQGEIDFADFIINNLPEPGGE